MHKSPTSGHSELLSHTVQVRTALIRIRPVWKRLIQTALLIGCSLQLLGVAVFAQDSQSVPDTAAQRQSADQPTSSTTSAELSDEVIKDVLSDFQRGFETHNLEKVLGVFDPDSMRDWGQFRDQMAAYFMLHESFRMRYQLLQVNADKDVGTATADIEMDEDPLDTLPTPKRRSTQMRFQIKRTPKGWRIIGLRPTEFFAF